MGHKRLCVSEATLNKVKAGHSVSYEWTRFREATLKKIGARHRLRTTLKNFTMSRSWPRGQKRLLEIHLFQQLKTTIVRRVKRFSCSTVRLMTAFRKIEERSLQSLSGCSKNTKVAEKRSLKHGLQQERESGRNNGDVSWKRNWNVNAYWTPVLWNAGKVKREKR